MRPPQNAGENPPRTRHAHGGMIGFNEAPAKRGGKRVGRNRDDGLVRRFNEAPAKRGGKRSDNVCKPKEENASMRPPQNAGENGALSDAATMRLPAWHCERFAAGMAARPRELRPVVHCGAY